MESINGSAGTFGSQGVTTARPIPGRAVVSRPMTPLLDAGEKSRQDTLELSPRYKAFAAVDEDTVRPIFNPPMEVKLPAENESLQKSTLTGVQKRGLRVYADFIRLALHLDGRN